MDILTLGEALIDLPSTRSGVGLADAPSFAKVPAGAPANVAVAAVRLGLSAAFVTKVGADPFGEAIVQTFGAQGVDTTRVVRDPAARTGLAFVSVMPDGDREFLFYFDPARDLALRPDELDPSQIADARAFHYGSISLIAEPSRSTTLSAARLARENGAICSYDPNLRPRLWPDERAMRASALAGFAEADIAKVSDDELSFLAETPDGPASAARLFDAYPRLRLLAVTAGAGGSTGYTRDGQVVHAPGFAVALVDATGAGDAYGAGLIATLLRRGADPVGALETIADGLDEMLRFANACGAVATTGLGATPDVLTGEAVQALLATADLPLSRSAAL